jgi:hypothetical protein
MLIIIGVLAVLINFDFHASAWIRKPVNFELSKVNGDSYKRPLGASKRYISSTSTSSNGECPQAQVHIGLGNKPGSIIVSFASNNASTVSSVEYTENASAFTTPSSSATTKFVLGSKVSFSSLISVTDGVYAPYVGKLQNLFYHIIIYYCLVFN